MLKPTFPGSLRERYAFSTLPATRAARTAGEVVFAGSGSHPILLQNSVAYDREARP
jgi:hypothetical protein